MIIAKTGAAKNDIVVARSIIAFMLDANHEIMIIAIDAIDSRYMGKMRLFFLENNFNNDGRIKRKILNGLRRVLSRNEKTARFWLSLPVTKVLKVFPYFIFHFLFERLVSTDIECQEIWANTKKISARPLMKFMLAENISHFPDYMKDEIDELRAPLYKINWKSDFSQYGPSSALHYLLETRSAPPEVLGSEQRDRVKKGL